MRAGAWRTRLLVAFVVMGMLVPVTALELQASPAGATTPAVSVTGGGFVALTPSRILDASAAANVTTKLTVLGSGGVPASGVSAVTLNVTVESSAQAGGYLTVFPDGVTRPTTSNLNFNPGATIGNSVVVKVGAGGKVDLTNSSGGSVELFVDVQGYFKSGTVAPGGLTALTPARLMDTRNGTGGITGPVARAAVVKLSVLGHGGVPTSGVGAVVLNVTAASSQTGGYLTVFPDGVARPATSNLNFRANETFPNLVIVKVGSDGKVDFFNGTSGTIRLVADVQGWFKTGAPAAGGFTPLTPGRRLDTRNATGGITGPVASGATISLPILGHLGVPPSGVGAVVLNVTAVASTGAGHLTVYADGISAPSTWNVSFPTNKTVPELVTVAVGADGKVAFTNTSGESVQIVADIFGWFRTTTPLTGIQQVVSNGLGACAVTTGGGVDCWGANPDGELGSGSTTGPEKCPGDDDSVQPCATTAVRVKDVGGTDTLANVTNLVQDGAGYCALLSSTGVDCWGANGEGSVGNGSMTGPSHCYGGEICAPYPVAVVGVGGSGMLSGVTALANSSESMCALMNSGGVDCWGSNQFGQLGDGTTTNRAVPTPVVGTNGSGTLSGIASIVGEYEGFCAITNAGGVDCWGQNYDASLGQGVVTGPSNCSGLPCSKHPAPVLGVGGTGTLSGVTTLTSGAPSVCALTTSGTLDCWGDNANGQLGTGSTTGPDSCTDGALMVPCSDTPVTVVGVGGSGTLSSVASVTTGSAGMCAVLTSGHLDCWGWNIWGFLGNGTYGGPEWCFGGWCSTAPVQVAGVGGSGLLANVQSVSAGPGGYCALISSGTVDCWGDNSSGQLGIGTFTGPEQCYFATYDDCATTPVAVRVASTTMTGVTALSSGFSIGELCALDSSGGVACWGGPGDLGRLGNSSTDTSNTAVTVLSP